MSSNPLIFDYTKNANFSAESKFRSEDCNQNQQGSENHSIFKYMTDTNMYINKNRCLDDTPSFMPYISTGIPTQSVDIENDLRGITRPNTRCSSKKWQSPDQELIETVSTVPVYNKELCKPEQKILPSGYFKDPILKWDGKQFILTDPISGDQVKRY
jgi:hypothetical protein